LFKTVSKSEIKKRCLNILYYVHIFLHKSKIWPHLDRKVNVCVCERLNTRGVVRCIHSLPCFSENIHAQEQSEDSKKEVNTARRKSSCERVCVCVWVWEKHSRTCSRLDWHDTKEERLQYDY